MTIGWLDLSAGASGDMLLGALVDAGVPLEVPAEAVAALPVERIRLVLGVPGDDAPTGPVVLETNVDDLDPRLWPGVLDTLFAAGASDAWLTPILMKKGRPAHTLSVLCRPETVTDVQAAVFATTSSIGLRIVPVGKVAIERAQASVDVLGGRVGVKVAVSGGRMVNVSVEYEDVAALARELGLPVKEVLRAATAAAERAYPAG